MWKAIIAKKEDDFYYLLKTFAESLESDLLKAAKPKQEDSVVKLIRLMNVSHEELNSYMKRKLIPLNKEIEELTEKNKKLLAKLKTAEKRKETQYEPTDKINEELKDINMQLRAGKVSDEEKNKLTQRAKELRSKLSEIQANNRSKTLSQSKEANEKTKEITDDIKENDEKRKKIKARIEELKVNYRQNQRTTALRNYLKSPTDKNLVAFQSLFFSTRQLLDVKDSEKGKTEIKDKAPSQFNKTQLDADLKALGWDGTGKTAKLVLDNIKTRKENDLNSKKFSIMDLTENVTSANYVRRLKSLVKENKPLLDSLTEANRLLSFEGDSREYFRNILDTKKVSTARGKSNVKDKFDWIHSEHRGAIARISQVLQNIYYDKSVSEKDSKLAYKLSEKLIQAIKDLDNFKVYGYSQWGDNNKKTEIGETSKQKEIVPNNLFASTLEVYEDMLKDLNLTESQEKDLADLGDKGKVYEEVEQKLSDFITKLKINENLQIITMDIINAIMGVSDASLERFVKTRAYDKDYNIYYDQNFSEKEDNLLVDAIKELKEELNNDLGDNARKYDKYYEKINEILDSAGFIDSRLTRGRIKRRKLSEALSSEEYLYSARRHLSKNLLPLLEKLNQKGLEEEPTWDGGSKVLDNAGFENLVNYIENPNKETFDDRDIAQNERYLSRLLMSAPNTKLGKKINRVFKNKQTKKYLSMLGLLGGDIQEKSKEEKE
jgi:hypothetical protein